MRRDSPRHIRDIAHLYLSRGRSAGARPPRLLVAGTSPDVMPGFHAANLALTAASGGMTVRIVEASGLPVSAGCFLGLDPSCWVASGRPPDAMVSAFARVSFTWRSSIAAPPRGDGAENVLEIVHVPPWDARNEHARIMEAGGAGPALLLYLAERDTAPRPWLDSERGRSMPVRVAFMTRADAAASGKACCAGVVTRWRAALTDPLPAALRDPASRLSRQYRDLLANLLAVNGQRPPGVAAARHATIRPL